VLQSDKDGRGKLDPAEIGFLFPAFGGLQDPETFRQFMNNARIMFAGWGTIPPLMVTRLRNLAEKIEAKPRFLAWSRSLENPAYDGGKALAKAKQFEVSVTNKTEMVETANVVSLNLPDEATKEMPGGVFLDEKDLRRLVERSKSEPIVVINTARQSNLDHEALARILEEYIHAGIETQFYYFADIDLAKKDPQTKEIVEIPALKRLRDPKFRKHVFFTNHIGAFTQKAMAKVEKRSAAVVRELFLVASGQKKFPEANLDFVVPPAKRSEVRWMQQPQPERVKDQAILIKLNYPKAFAALEAKLKSVPSKKLHEIRRKNFSQELIRSLANLEIMLKVFGGVKFNIKRTVVPERMAEVVFDDGHLAGYKIEIMNVRTEMRWELVLALGAAAIFLGSQLARIWQRPEQLESTQEIVSRIVAKSATPRALAAVLKKIESRGLEVQDLRLENFSPELAATLKVLEDKFRGDWRGKIIDFDLSLSPVNGFFNFRHRRRIELIAYARAAATTFLNGEADTLDSSSVAKILASYTKPYQIKISNIHSRQAGRRPEARTEFLAGITRAIEKDRSELRAGTKSVSDLLPEWAGPAARRTIATVRLHLLPDWWRDRFGGDFVRAASAEIAAPASVDVFQSILAAPSSIKRQVLDQRSLIEDPAALDAILRYAIHHPEVVSYQLLFVAAGEKVKALEDLLRKYAVERYQTFPANLTLRPFSSEEAVVTHVRAQVSTATVPVGFVAEFQSLAQAVGRQGLDRNRPFLRVLEEQLVRHDTASILTAEKLGKQLEPSLFVRILTGQELDPDRWGALLTVLRNELRSQLQILASA